MTEANRAWLKEALKDQHIVCNVTNKGEPGVLVAMDDGRIVSVTATEPSRTYINLVVGEDP